MSERKWNEHQLRAISLRGQSIVISAAAGSGKTSVLSERVLRLIEEGEDLSRMLIVTFTSLAAGEMRNRIYQRLQEAGKQDTRLAAQAEKCAFADISTLHSFCGRLIRDNFAQAGVSPTFAIADEAETTKLKQLALDEVIEEALGGAQRHIVLKYAGRGEMDNIKSIVTTIYNRAISLKDPAGWLAKSRAHFDGGAFVDVLFEEYKKMAYQAAQQAAACLDQRTRLWRESGFEDEALQSQNERSRLLQAVEAMTSRKAYLPQISVISSKAKGAPNRGSKSLTTSANKHLEEVRLWEGDFAARVTEELRQTADDGRFFIDLTSAFMARYAKLKRAKNLLDHDDTMHLAIRVLSCPDIAARYRDKYAHVFVDEYQDINEAQHTIISALCRGNNDFLVGDVKQCIYMFRESNPDLLLRRCRELSGSGLIEMNTNYRSIPPVIDFINDVMENMMTEQAGGVRYAGGQRLAAGLPCEPAESGNCVDIVLAGRENEDGEDTLDSIEAEAAQLAELIGELVAEGFAYNDIAVLRPELSATGQQLAQALRNRRIPVAGAPAGDPEFSELAVFINLLRVIDNPADVPLLSVLRYPYYGLDERDFARIRIAAGEDATFVQAALAYCRDDETGRRLKRFWDQIAQFRRMAACMKLPDFLIRIRQEAQFREYALTSPGGTADEAISAFIRNVAEANPRSLADVLDLAERMQPEIDAQPDPKTADGVYLTTIHRSKGLEFPAVILCGLHKKINQSDAKGPVLVGRDLGIGLKATDEERYIRRHTLHSVAVMRTMKHEKISETVRLLYVGMTRAIRRLILLGAGSRLADKWLEDRTDGWQLDANTYFDLLMPAIRMSGRNLEDVVRILPGTGSGATPESSAQRLKELLDAARACPPAAVFTGYAKSGDLGVPSKVSVSALKRLHEQSAFLNPQRPSAEDDGITAAERGTLMHRVLEIIGLSCKTADEVSASVQQLASSHHIDADLAKHVDADAIARFLHSELAARARAAQKCLFEQPFCLSMSARELSLADSDEAVIVQGVIDMCFLEDGRWIIVDYKTDRVDAGSAQQAAQKYALQLSLYARALSDITRLPVAETWIYYLSAGEAVKLQAAL